MTREEAINTLKENYCAMCFYGSQDMESCDIRYCDNKDAIQALEQELTTKNDLGISSGLKNGSPIIDWNNCHTPKQLDSIATIKNDLALIHTEGLDEEIRCAMCTNSMANDRGCDGSCVVNNAMYKKVMDVIESHIAEVPSVTPQEPRKGYWRPIYQGDEIIDYRCSECEFGNTFGKGTIGMNFCPRCGAKMEEVEK